MADTTFTAVDLSRLPAPAVIEQLSFETIRADMLARLQLLLLPEFDAFLESDPVVKLVEVFAYREMLIRARVNDGGRAVMPAYATGADLDNLAALVGVTRLLITANAVTGAAAVYENDTDLRRRMVLAPEGYSVAGPEGAYIFHALSADAAVLDASATSPTPGTVIVAILARPAYGTADAALIAKVEGYLSDDTRRPLTDNVVVQAATLLDYQVTAQIRTFAGPDAAIVLAASRQRLDAYVEASRRLGRDVTRSGIIAALHSEGVQNVTLSAPAADLVVGRTQAARCLAITVTHAGIDE